MSNLDDLVTLTRWAGERFDLIQAGGGNSSFKTDDGVLWVKSSGVQLANVTGDTGFCSLRREALLALLSALVKNPMTDKQKMDDETAEQTHQAMTGGTGRPSIETLLHAQMRRYTLHTHPVAVTAMASMPDWRELFMGLFPDALCLSYETPGAALARILYRALEKQPDARMVFLQNHGLLISGDGIAEVMDRTEQVVSAVESKLGVDLSSYKRVSALSAWVSDLVGEPLLAYYCNDQVIMDCLKAKPDLLRHGPVCPDQLVYCGPAPLVISSDELPDAVLKEYLSRWRQYPRVVLWREGCYVLAPSLAKCRDAAEVLRFHLLALSAGKKFLTLPETELHYLMGWSAEKYRQKL